MTRTRLPHGTTGRDAEDTGGEAPGTADTVGVATDKTRDVPVETAPGNAPEGVPGEPSDDHSDTDDGAGGRTTPRWRKAALAVTVAALLLGGAAFFHGAHQLRSAPAARNHALTDTTATTRVGGDVAEGLARVFSYAPAEADAAARSAGTVLGGRAARQYTDLFAQVRENLVKQRVTLTTQAVRTGVIELDGDTARLLVFLDQTSRRDKGPATSAAAQLTVTAEFRGDRWQIVDIKAR